MNILEHIEDDRGTLRDFAPVLPPNGRLVLLVPSLAALYGSPDIALGHFRRAEQDALAELVKIMPLIRREAEVVPSFGNVAVGACARRQ